MKNFQVSGILLICLYILHNQGHEAKSSRRHPGRHDHGKHRNVAPQQDYPNANGLVGDYVAVAKLRGYITKKHKKTASNIIKNQTASPTEDKLEYDFFPSSTGMIQFKLRADNDVYIALSCSAVERDPMYEVFIGGWSNDGSVILSKFRGFWVRWNNGTISAGNEGNSTSFLSYTDSEKLMIEYVEVRTGRRASGSWTIEQGDEGHWVAVEHGSIPPGAYPGGEQNGEPMYIIRANNTGGLIPGSLVSGNTSFKIATGSNRIIYVPDGLGGVISMDMVDINSYEVLCDFGGNWQQFSGDAIPSNAVVAGKTADGEPLYVGRVKHEGSLIVGRVQAKDKHMLCFIKYNDQEIESAEYEILVA